MLLPDKIKDGRICVGKLILMIMLPQLAVALATTCIHFCSVVASPAIHWYLWTRSFYLSTKSVLLSVFFSNIITHTVCMYCMCDIHVIFYYSHKLLVLVLPRPHRNFVINVHIYVYVFVWMGFCMCDCVYALLYFQWPPEM